MYLGSKSSVALEIVSAAVTDFSLSPGTATVTAFSGSNAPGVTFTVASLNGFSGSVTFQATTTSATLSTTSSPSFSVNPVVLAVSAPGSTVLTLSAFSAKGRTRSALASGGALVGLLGLLVRRRRRWAGLVAALSVGVLSLSGCGALIADGTSSAQVDTPAGTYTVLVTATGTGSTGTVTSHNATLTFVVQ